MATAETNAAHGLPAIEVYSTLTRAKSPLVTVKPGAVGMYLCGPTVYKPSHIGHMVGPVIFDTVKRHLAYSGWQVTWVVNITDVDDKIIAESTARGTTMAKLAEEMTAEFEQDVARSRRITLEEWKSRPLQEKIFEHAMSLFGKQL